MVRDGEGKMKTVMVVEWYVEKERGEVCGEIRKGFREVYEMVKWCVAKIEVCVGEKGT